MAKTLTSSRMDKHYYMVENLVQQRVKMLHGPLFRTSVDGLWELFLQNLDAPDRQHYNCKCCKKFIEDYGGLVELGETGIPKSALWTIPLFLTNFFYHAVQRMKIRVETARVTGVFVNDELEWGTPLSPTGWSHLSGSPEKMPKYKDNLKSAFSREAELKQDYILVQSSLWEFAPDALVQARRILEADAIPEAKRYIGMLDWIVGLHSKVAQAIPKHMPNVVWHAVAQAPPGFAHFKNTMLGTLLQDIVRGADFETLRDSWVKKVAPDKFMRPQSAPEEGNIKQAEEMVAKLGVAASLKRRFARLEDLQPYWVPHAEPVDLGDDKPSGTVFDHLRKLPKTTVKEVELPPKVMTWEKFKRDVIPTAKRIELDVPVHGNFFAFVTAEDPSAPSILQWDWTYKRNPVSWFVFKGGSPAAIWNLDPFRWAKVQMICDNPAIWTDPVVFKKHEGAAYLVLAGAKLTLQQKGGLFFPDFLRSEFYPVRKTLEAFSENAVVTGVDQSSASGYCINGSQPHKLRVNGRDIYHIDRWE